ncbi:MAG: tRNA 2-thiouridine(34) synthase MnmA [Lachnospiraceae bacterium]|nr:tRNA 2-thiouridine(34) synthase MnmA [Lachnospiraceae bacterium]
MAKVIVGMSGGVDSAVTAYLLQLAGHEVIGLTLRTWLSADGKESRCCEIDDARRVAWRLNIPYYVQNCISDFQSRITDPFIEAYLQGTTPNPCVYCNRLIKWEGMMRSAEVMGASYVATGHYATVVQKNGRYTVQKASHAAKDQTYMLYRLSQKQLAKTLMPLGKLTKEEVRKIAQTAGLPVAQKPDSQEICFVSDGNYADYIEEHAAGKLSGEGDFVDEDGRKLGTHRGIIHYTVGQRKGLGIAFGEPRYVKEIRAERGEIVLGKETELYRRQIFCQDLNFLSIPGLATGEAIEAIVKIRYHHEGQWARIVGIHQDLVKITFAEAVRAPAPGQSAVFYDPEGCVIGGGIIE